jgi:hypothetical protein
MAGLLLGVKGSYKGQELLVAGHPRLFWTQFSETCLVVVVQVTPPPVTALVVTVGRVEVEVGVLVQALMVAMAVSAAAVVMVPHLVGVVALVAVVHLIKVGAVSAAAEVGVIMALVGLAA